METLERKFLDAVAAKERVVERQLQELDDLKFLSLRSRALPIYWSASINSKNARRAIEQAQILDAFKQKADLHKTSVHVSKVRFTLRQLWTYTQRSPSGPIKGRFKNDLNSLKDEGLITRTSDGKGWCLTPEGVEALAHE